MSGAVTSLRASTSEVATHIARVAARLFAARGYDATSVREIVEAAGVTKPTLYYHFGSKQGLAEALLTRPMTEFLASLQELFDVEINAVRLLRRMVEAHVRFITAEPDRGRFLYAVCFGPQASSLQEEMHRFGEAIEARTLECAERLARAGVIDERRVESCSKVIRGIIMSSTLDQVLLCRPVDPGLAGRLVVDLLQGFARPGFPIEGTEEASEDR